MKDIDEKLSFLLDDCPGGNTDAAIDEVIGDVNLQYRMRRYRMIGDAMRHELPQAIDTGFHSTVMARIRDQIKSQSLESTAFRTPAVTAPVTSWVTLKPFAGLALAAGVAIVTVALWQPLGQEVEQIDDGLATIDQQMIQQLASQQLQVTAVPVSTRVQVSGMRWKIESESPGMQQKLNGYLVNHTEYSNSMQGLIPQARVAGFDSSQ